MRSEKLFDAFGDIADSYYEEDYKIISGKNGTNRLKLSSAKRKTLRTVLTAAVTGILLIGTVTALAVGDIIDLRAFYDSIFRNEEAAPYIVGADGITEVVTEQNTSNIADDDDIAEAMNMSELHIMLVASFVTGKTAYVELEITGENIPDTLYFFNHETIYNDPVNDFPGEVRERYEEVVWSLTDTTPLVTRLDENTVRVSLTLTQGYFTYHTFAEDDVEITSIEQLTGLLIFDTISSSNNPADSDAILFTGDWQFEFDIIDVGGIFHTIEIGEHWGVLIVTATHASIGIHSYEGFDNGFNYPYEEEGALELVLNDGTIITPRFSSSEIYSFQIPMIYDITYVMDFIDPNKIETIIFCGIKLEDTKCPGDGGA